MGKRKIGEQWVPQAQLAHELHISERAIERLATQGHIRSCTRRTRQRRPVIVVHPEDSRYLKAVVENLAFAPIVVWPVVLDLEHASKAAA